MAGPLPVLPPRRGRSRLHWSRGVPDEPATVLVAGIGNIFLSDDGFGVEVANRLADEALPAGSGSPTSGSAECTWPTSFSTVTRA